MILRTRPEAELILERLFDILEKFEMVTVADFYDLLNEKATPQDEKYGWLALRGASIRRVRGGYLIDLPTPEVLD